MCGTKGANFALVAFLAASRSLVVGILAGAPCALSAPAFTPPTAPRFDLLHRTAGELNFIVDDATGVRVGIPVGIVSSSRRETYGRNWQAPDNRMSIDTLLFRDRTLQALYATLRKKSGRRITNGEITATDFLLEGVDSDGTLFHVKARTQGGEIRGLSVVYSSRARNEVAGIAQAMLNSFEPFPGTGTATIQVDSRSAELERHLADAKRREEELLKREDEERRKANAQSGANDRRIAELERQLTDIRRREEEIKREEERRKATGQGDTRIAELERQLAEIKRRESEITKRDEEERRKAKEDRDRVAREDAIRKEEQEKASKERQSLLKQLEARQEKASGEFKSVGLPPGKRVALVVGINSYESLMPLKTAVNDAMAISRTLQTMGFSVVEGVELNWRGFYTKWLEFLNEIEGGGTAVFFFAGHGIQIDGANFLLPKDVSGASVAEEMLRRESVNFNELRKELLDRRPALSLFILDACRNNPYQGNATRALSNTRGLARVDAARGTFVMYSADPGEEALDRLPNDGENETNSLYTRHLIPLLTGDQTLQAIAQHVRAEVRGIASKVKHSQTPAYYDGLVGLVCLSAPCARAARSASRN